MVFVQRRIRAGTLIEAAVASAVVAICALGGFSFIQFGRQALDQAKNERIAARMAQAKIEELRSIAYVSILGETENGLTLGNITGTRETTVARGPDDAYRDVTVEITWGTNGSVTLQTIVSANGQSAL